jgi:hypothetical protein
MNWSGIVVEFRWHARVSEALSGARRCQAREPQYAPRVREPR